MNMVIEKFQCIGYSLISSVYYRANHSWAKRKAYQNKDSRMAGKRYFGIGFCKYS